MQCKSASKAQGLLALLPLPPKKLGLQSLFNVAAGCTTYHLILMPDLLPASHESL